MKKYKGTRCMEDIESLAKEQGWVVDIEAFEKTGSDFIYLRDVEERMKQIALNVTNGHFFVYEPISEKPTASHLSSDLDEEEWYIEILDLLYEPLEV